MGTAFVDGVTSLLSNITTWFTQVFGAIGGVLYTAGTDGNAGSLTVIGWIFAIICAMSVVGFGLRLVLNLVRRLRA